MQRRIQHRKPLAQVQQLAAQRISGSAADQRQTGGMVEHFNGRISDLIALTRFSSVAELQTNLKRYRATYKHSVPQRPLHHRSAIQTLKIWPGKKPELFVKRGYDQSGLDSRKVADHVKCEGPLEAVDARRAHSAASSCCSMASAAPVNAAKVSVISAVGMAAR